MKIINATVKYRVGRVIKTNYGESQSAKITLENGTEADVWCVANSNDEVFKWQVGDKVQVYLNQHNKYKAIETERPFPAVIVAPPTSVSAQAGKFAHYEAAELAMLTDEAREKKMIEMMMPSTQTKKQMAAYIGQMSQLYGYCLKMAKQNVDCDDLKPEAVKDIATTIFIQTSRKFNI